MRSKSQTKELAVRAEPATIAINAVGMGFGPLGTLTVKLQE
jgi:hypothetical protein